MKKLESFFLKSFFKNNFLVAYWQVVQNLNQNGYGCINVYYMYHMYMSCGTPVDVNVNICNILSAHAC